MSTLLHNAINILSQAHDRFGAMSTEWDDALDSPNEPILKRRLIVATQLYESILSQLILNVDGDEITGVIGTNYDQLNKLLLWLQRETKVSGAVFPTPLRTHIVSVATKGDDGEDGESIVGPPGQDGAAYNFRRIDKVAGTHELDRFDANDGVSCDWRWNIRNSANTNMRRHSGEALWKPGSIDTDDLKFSYNGGPKIIGTDPNASVIIMARLDTGTNEIVLEAIISDGTWTIEGERRFTPTDGSYTDPVLEALAEGYIPIGQADNTPEGKPVSGAISIDKDGVTVLNEGIISNSHIAVDAGIEYDKMEALDANIGLGTDGDGKVTPLTGSVTSILFSTLTAGRVVITNLVTGKLEISTVTKALLEYLTGLTGNVQDQFTNKVSKLGDIMSGALINLVTGEFRGGLRTGSSGPYLKTAIVNIGDWNMDSTSGVTIAFPSGITRSNFRSAVVTIKSDAAGSDWLSYDLLIGGNYQVSNLITPADTISLNRDAAGVFDSTIFDSISYNRGWIQITYEA
jgi:hypothetical protein